MNVFCNRITYGCFDSNMFRYINYNRRKRGIEKMIQNVVISLMHIKDYKKINELFVELHQGHVYNGPMI